ncbi:uncharacterized protein LOC116757167 isoform X2 [Phocoena sinus]|uniref:uncharacterized protein LOC116757167 isoform X2 n=1 Tax=Phocoena sinus TaxID=42100 RepID=UPI0013C47172|nr:uncharacterized protein LOC116757167 isoform X2 [Phocoena sinus]
MLALGSQPLCRVGAKVACEEERPTWGGSEALGPWPWLNTQCQGASPVSEPSWKPPVQPAQQTERGAEQTLSLASGSCNNPKGLDHMPRWESQVPLPLHLHPEPNNGFWSHVPAAATFQLIRDEHDVDQSLFPVSQKRGPRPQSPPWYRPSCVPLTASTQSRCSIKHVVWDSTGPLFLGGSTLTRNSRSWASAPGSTITSYMALSENFLSLGFISLLLKTDLEKLICKPVQSTKI